MGVAVKEFETSLEFYTLIGYKKTTNNPIRDNLQKVDLYLLEHDLHPRIELVKPYEKDSPVNSYLKKTDNIIYHYCYEVKNFEQVVTNLKEKFRIFNVSKPKPAILFDNRLVTFYYINNVGLIELLENEK
jgi:methylmalonyl-CoA/ethylmalonyl-CoA epimerase